MKIKIGTFSLTGDDMREWPDNLRINGRLLAQESQFLRAVQVRMRARGNRKTVITFDIKRLHESIQEAQTFMLLHFVDVPNSGLITLSCVSDGGGEKDIYLANGVAEVVDYSHKGQTSFYTYQITGGQPTETKPS